MTVEAISNIDVNQDNALSKQEFGDVLSLLQWENTRDSEDFKDNFRDLFWENEALKQSLLDNISQAFSTWGLTWEQITQMSKAHMYLFWKPFRFEWVEIESMSAEKALDNFIWNENIPVDLKEWFLDFMTSVIEWNSAFDLWEFDYNRDGNLNYLELKDLRQALNEETSKIIQLGSYEKFKQVSAEINGGIKMFAIPKEWIRELINSVSWINKHDSEALLSKKYWEEGFTEGLVHWLSREVPGQVGDLCRLLADIKLMQTFNRPLMQYMDCMFDESPEARMKAEALKEAHPFIAMISIAEKPIETAKWLWQMLSNPSQWTAWGISTVLSALADPLVAAKWPTLATKASTAVNKAWRGLAKATQEAAENTAKMMSGPELAYATVRASWDDIMEAWVARADDLVDNNMYSIADTWNAGVEKVKWVVWGKWKKEAIDRSAVNKWAEYYVNRTLPEEQRAAYMIPEDIKPADGLKRIERFSELFETWKYSDADTFLKVMDMKPEFLNNMEDIIKSQLVYWAKLVKENPWYKYDVWICFKIMNKKLGTILEQPSVPPAVAEKIENSVLLIKSTREQILN